MLAAKILNMSDPLAKVVYSSLEVVVTDKDDKFIRNYFLDNASFETAISKLTKQYDSFVGNILDYGDEVVVLITTPQRFIKICEGYPAC